MIEMNCPNCGHELKIDDKFAGQSGNCKSCQQKITVPGGFVRDQGPPELIISKASGTTPDVAKSAIGDHGRQESGLEPNRRNKRFYLTAILGIFGLTIFALSIPGARSNSSDDASSERSTPKPSSTSKPAAYESLNQDLSLSQRKNIFVEIIQVERQAMSDAESMYPTQAIEQANKYDSLVTQYKRDLALEYERTDEQLKAIGLEGVTNGFPVPPIVDSASSFSTPTASQQDTIYVVQGSSIYHRKNCQHLTRATHPINSGSISEALQLGFRACKVCKP